MVKPRGANRVLDFTLAAVLSGIAAPRAEAQVSEWLEVQGSTTLTLRKGETASYHIRLKKVPIELDRETGEPVLDQGAEKPVGRDKKWWVRIRADGEVRYGRLDADGDPDTGWDDPVTTAKEGYDLTWIPSVGRAFHKDNWNRWVDIRIRAHSDINTSVTFSHEVWSNATYCPEHGVGQVTVSLNDSGGGSRGSRGSGSSSSSGGSNGSGSSSGGGSSGGGGSNSGGGSSSGGGNGSSNGNGSGNGSGIGGSGVGGGGGLELQPQNARAREDSGTLVFPVALSGVSQSPVSARWTTANGTATAAADYSSGSGTLTIPAGARSGRIEVPILNDLLDEHDETLVIRFDQPQGAGLATTEAIGTIQDDDDEPALLIEDASAPEGDGRIGFLVFLATDSGRTVSVDYATRAVSATSEMDYRPVSGTLTIPPGSAGERIWVAVLDDSLDEEHETMEMVLRRPRYAVPGDFLALGTIEDDDAEPQPGVPDVTVAERSGGMEFVVTLGGASAKRITWDYRTVDGTATAGEDFDGQAGTLTFAPGKTRATLPIRIVNDTMDEVDEDFRLRLTNPREPGSPAVEATAVIVDDDDNAIVADAWVSRFGRTVATQVVDAVGNRFANMDGPGSHFLLGSDPVRSSLAFGGVERYRRWMPHSLAAPPRATGHASLGLDAGQLLAGASFAVQSQDGQPEGGGFAGRWTAWGRGSYREFDGLDPGVGLRGEVFNVTSGFDVQSGALTAGLALAGSVGTGEYHVAGTEIQSERLGKIWSLLGSVHPYVHVSLAEWLRVWGLGGIGSGTVRISGGEEDADLHMRMWAFGGRGDLPLSFGPGFGLALKSDVFWVELESDPTDVRRGSVAEAQRTRLLLEGSFRFASIWGGELSPLVEAGFRQDSGDAESGRGLEVASGLRYRNRDHGLLMEVTGRSLVTHEDARYREWGVGGSVRLDPGPDYLGLAVQMNSAHGAAASTVQRLWSDTSAAAYFPATVQGRHEAEIGYGFKALRGGAMVIPFSGFAYSPSGAKSFRLGSRVKLGSRWMLSLQADRSRYTFFGPSYGVVLRGQLLPEIRASHPAVEQR